MNKDDGIQQTTTGIWMTKLEDQNLIIADVEGISSSERSDTQIQKTINSQQDNTVSFIGGL